MSSEIQLSIVVPVFNEADNIRLLWQRGNAALKNLGIRYEWIFVNDGSTDHSLKRILEMTELHADTKYIDFSRNFGHQIAVTAGLEFSRGKAVVIIDGDLQDPPELIVKLWERYQEGFEVVYAQRVMREGESWLKKVTARWFYRIMKGITPFPIPIDTGDFRIMDRKVVDVLMAMPERHKFIRGQVAWVGFRQTSLPYSRKERNSGATSYSWGKMVRFALDGITAFSDIPLRLVTYIGFAVSVIAFVLGLYALYSRFISQDYVPGWASLMITILFLGGVQMIGIGIIGEYISRIQSDVRQRPLYIIRQSNVSNE